MRIVEVAMRIVEPSWPLIVKLGQGARLQDRSRFRLTGMMRSG
jgi:hypothetical protein